MNQGKQRNPLHILVGIAGVAFGLTACAYGLMMVVELRSPGMGRGPGLLGFMSRYGTWLLVGELVVLAIGSVAAIGLDSLRQKREEQTASGNMADSRGNES